MPKPLLEWIPRAPRPRPPQLRIQRPHPIQRRMRRAHPVCQCQRAIMLRLQRRPHCLGAHPRSSILRLQGLDE
jgi:hypothetical protein